MDCRLLRKQDSWLGLLRLSLFLAVLFSLASCGGGGGGGGGSASSPAPTLLDIPVEGALSGYVAKGPVRGALVEVYSRDPGSIPQLLASVRTDANGYYSVASLPPDKRILEIVASGGDYIDEATNERVSLEQPLRGIVVRQADHTPATLTVFSEVIVRRTERRLMTEQLSPRLIGEVSSQVANELLSMESAMNVLPVDIMKSQDWSRYYASDISASILLAAVSKFVADAVSTGHSATRTAALTQLVDALDQPSGSEAIGKRWVEAVFDIAAASALPAQAKEAMQQALPVAPLSERIESGGPLNPLPADGEYHLVLGIPERSASVPYPNSTPTHTVEFDSRGALKRFVRSTASNPNQDAFAVSLFTARVRELYGDSELSGGVIGGGALVSTSNNPYSNRNPPYLVRGSNGLLPYTVFRIAAALPTTCHTRVYRLKHVSKALIADDDVQRQYFSPTPTVADDRRSTISVAFFSNGYSLNANLLLESPSGSIYPTSQQPYVGTSPWLGMLVPNGAFSTTATMQGQLELRYSNGVAQASPLSGSMYFVGRDARKIAFITTAPRFRAQTVVLEADPAEDSQNDCSPSTAAQPQSVSPPSGQYLVWASNFGTEANLWQIANTTFAAQGQIASWTSGQVISQTYTPLPSQSARHYSDALMTMGWHRGTMALSDSDGYATTELLGAYFAVSNPVAVDSAAGSKRYRLRYALQAPLPDGLSSINIALSDLEVEIIPGGSANGFLGLFSVRASYDLAGQRYTAPIETGSYRTPPLIQSRGSGLPGYEFWATQGDGLGAVQTSSGQFVLFGNNGSRMVMALTSSTGYPIQGSWLVVLDQVVGP